MKILQAHKFHYLRGGAERYVFTLSDMLTRHGHTVIPFATAHPENMPTNYARYFPPYHALGKGEARSALDLVRGAARMLWSRRAARAFGKLLDDTTPDIVHVHNIYHHLSPSILPEATRRGIPVVMTVHDYQLVWPDYLLCGYAPGASPLRVIRKRCVQGSFAKSAYAAAVFALHRALGAYTKHINRVIVPSHFVGDVLRARGISAKRIVHIPHSVPEVFFTQPKTGKRDERHALFAGRLSEEKGIKTLLALAADSSYHGVLTIAGDGPLRAAVAAAAEKNERFSYASMLDDAALIAALDRATAVVAPSTAPETFGLILAEAMARGTPVVASGIGAFKELCANGCGVVVKDESPQAWASALNGLFADAPRRRALGKAGARFVRTTLDPETHYERIMEVYEGVNYENRHCEPRNAVERRGNLAKVS